MMLRPIHDTYKTEHATTENHTLEVYNYPEMTFLKKVECKGMIVDIEKYIPEKVQFIPGQYFRNYSDFYIVDRWNRHVLKLGSTLEFVNFLTLEQEAIKIITGPVSPYFLVQFKDWKIVDLSGKLQTTLNYPQVEIKCGSATNTGIVLVDKFDNIHVYESSEYIKRELGINSTLENDHILGPKFESVTKSVMGPIADVQCGFFHCVFRTWDGRVFAAGFDNLNQITFGINMDGQPNFMEQSNLLNLDSCIRIGCFSRGHYLINAKNDVFFVAEMFGDFKTAFTHKKYSFVQVMNLDEIAVRTRELRNGAAYNSVVNAGWHCCVAFDHRHSEKPSRFRNRLYDCYTGCKVSDISISFQ
ncbi:hypothetical protein NAEGRDRAFT_58759 [Naegleria gruberi]|uniref:Uncharacterized protein n=1 Tax=Naegleria gruberi TaxID=5762 RepID=D2VNI9_NAEGR|nr:uncharacterized protein NAEGRDRAFT_58759 [Naegleria gruberi]EFC41744.1 hypothetical protein NAEGRDRAFT_58759 [Naegleria gruberi]|eukprot:XP_002674488.1 hypothetical protein NAEGRDRAFT_58759 [Naegleria gruberi strain NEG-M]